MSILVLVVSALLIGTKFLDCYSTIRRLDLPKEELNPFARAAIIRLGKGTAIWGVFVIVIIVVAIVGGTAYAQIGGLPDDPEGAIPRLIIVWGYVLIGLVISGIQTCVAHTNWTGRFNIVTRILAARGKGVNPG